jgi:tetratricopeptide (TPR) repeat protein
VLANLAYSSIPGIPTLGVDTDTYAAACADWVDKNNPPGYMYNDLDIGGYLIFRFYPEHKVFWYNDLLVFEPMFKRLVAGETVERIHHIDWVIDVNSKENNPYKPDSWALMAFDPRFSLYIKRAGTAGSLIGSNEYSILHPCRPEEDFRNVADYPQAVKDQLVAEVDRFLGDNRTRWARSYAAGLFIMLGADYLPKARELLDAGLSDDGNYINYNFYDALYYYAKGDLAVAERKIRWVLLWHPRSNESRFLLGLIQASRGDLSDAKRIFDRVISDGYRTPGVYYARMKVLDQLGDRAGAIKMLNSYIGAVSPADHETREYADAIALGNKLTGGGQGQ